MPKIIDDARSKIIECAKNRMFAEGYDKLSLRSIAKDCHMAVGTIYNYFKDKETLLATIMLDDWNLALEKMDEGCKNAKTIENGFVSIYLSIKEFSSKFENIWSQFEGSNNVIHSRHHLLISQINERVIHLLIKFAFEQEKQMSTILAECVLSSALHDINEQELVYFINYLFSRKEKEHE